MMAENTNLSPQNKQKERGNTNVAFLGVSGTAVLGGLFYEEYLQKILHLEGIDVWDEMRRSDDQIKMLLRVVKNPILSGRWFVEAASDDEEDKKIADFITHILFEDLGTERFPKSFKKFQREALTPIEFGFALFEITHKIVVDDPKFGTYVGLKGLDWRSPKTIWEWKISKDGALEAVKQIDNSERALDVWLPGAFLLHIAPEMEGDLYEGISMLRPIYGNWFRKNIMLKLQMMGIERAATGVPLGIIPSGQINTSSQTAFESALSSFVSHEKQYLTLPDGYKVDSLKIAHDAEKVDAAIRREDQGMSKSFLANFMELGLNSGSGSWALGTDLSDIFLSGITVYADAVIDAVNIKLIPMMTRLNFGRKEKYPKLKIEGINDKGGKEFAEILQMLKMNDLLQISDRLKGVVHKRFNLPDFDSDLEKEKKEPIFDAKFSEITYNLAESNISRQISEIGDQLTGLISASVRDRGDILIERMMKIWRNAPRSQRMRLVNQLGVPGKDEYKKLLTDKLSDLYIKATLEVKKELERDSLKFAEKSEIKDLPSESKVTLSSQVDLLVESQDADLRKNLFFSFTSKADILPTEAQMYANLLDVVERYATGASVRVSGHNAAANALNLARNAIFQQKETLSQIESFVFENPSPKALICVHLRGRVFSKEEYIVSDKLPPLHHQCNSWIRAQITGRRRNEPISAAGLSIQGTGEQIEMIKKSITL